MPISPRVVHPTGPEHAEVLLVGEGPGLEEDRRRKPFVGKSGMVLWAMAADYCGIRRADVRVDNLMDRRHTDARDKDRGPTEAEFGIYAPALRRRVKEVGPWLVVTLGRYSTAALLRREVSMEVVNGCLYRTKAGRAVIPVVHPAAGLHQPEMLAATAYGLQQVGKFLQGGYVYEPHDSFPTPFYAQHIACGLRPVIYDEIAIDTEYDPMTGDPWCLTYSQGRGTGRLIRADDAATLRVFREALAEARPTVILHNALADLGPLRAMGIDLVAMGLPLRDTMAESFVIQHYPRGLKPLAERLCGMAMRSYSEVVGPVEERFARAYLQKALDEPEGAWCVPPADAPRKHSIVRRIESMLAPAQRAGAEEPKSIIEKWADADNFGAVREAIEAIHGPMPRPGLDDMPAEEFRDYACRDADATFRIAVPLHREVIADGLTRVLAVDTRPLPLLDRMSEVGMLVDVRALDDLRDHVRTELGTAARDVIALTGVSNPGSDDQIAAWAISAGLGLEKRTKSRKRIQVDENALLLVRFKHKGVEAILHYRELKKLDTAFITPLYGFLRGTGRFRTLHPRIRTASAVTGRLSMYDPNLMAYPTRTDLGRRIRACFVARPGKALGSCDLSQIELRGGAALSQDASMIQAFKDGVDLHTRTAAKFFHRDDSPTGMAKVSKLERAVIKVPNFGILYGAREHRLEAEFAKAGIQGYDLAACRDMIEWWFGEYPGVRTWIEGLLAEGRDKGYVTTEAGRRRYLPALRFESDEYPFNRLREEAERQATNFPIQGGAQEKEKEGMVVVQDEVMPALHDAGYYAEPLLQIHDELLVEVDEDCADLAGELMVEAMTRNSPWRGVPLGASWAVARTWGGLK